MRMTFHKHKQQALICYKNRGLKLENVEKRKKQINGKGYLLIPSSSIREALDISIKRIASLMSSFSTTSASRKRACKLIR